MKYGVLLLAMILVGCTNTDLRIGEHVSNGLCEGYIVTSFGDDVKVEPWTCREVSFNFVVISRSELHSIEPKEKK